MDTALWDKEILVSDIRETLVSEVGGILVSGMGGHFLWDEGDTGLWGEEGHWMLMALVSGGHGRLITHPAVHGFCQLTHNALPSHWTL